MTPLRTLIEKVEFALSEQGIPLPTRCAACELAYSEFRETQLLGCAHCYSEFSNVVRPLLKKLHGTSQHIGKIGQTGMSGGSRIQMLSQKKLELKEAIQREAFELAASLRDQITALEKPADRSER